MRGERGDAGVTQLTFNVGIVMTTPLGSRSANVGPESRRGVEVVAQTVQDLLHVAALANHQSSTVVYLPETFLTRW